MKLAISRALFWLSLGFFIAVVLPTSAAPVRTVYLPIASGPFVASNTMIYECQCGAVIATALDNGAVLLTILDHSRGGAVVVGIDNGVAFTEIEDAVPVPVGISPTFEFPGDKQGIGSSVRAFGGLVTYAPNRTEEGGRYNIWRFVYPGP